MPLTDLALAELNDSPPAPVGPEPGLGEYGIALHHLHFASMAIHEAQLFRHRSPKKGRDAYARAMCDLAEALNVLGWDLVPLAPDDGRSPGAEVEDADT